jgi:hypothetical protein
VHLCKSASIYVHLWKLAFINVHIWKHLCKCAYTEALFCIIYENCLCIFLYMKTDSYMRIYKIWFLYMCTFIYVHLWKFFIICAFMKTDHLCICTFTEGILCKCVLPYICIYGSQLLYMHTYLYVHLQKVDTFINAYIWKLPSINHIYRSGHLL